VQSARLIPLSKSTQRRQASNPQFLLSHRQVEFIQLLLQYTRDLLVHARDDVVNASMWQSGCAQLSGGNLQATVETSNNLAVPPLVCCVVVTFATEAWAPIDARRLHVREDVL
jgi:hypothetical protein